MESSDLRRKGRIGGVIWIALLSSSGDLRGCDLEIWDCGNLQIWYVVGFFFDSLGDLFRKLKETMVPPLEGLEIREITLRFSSLFGITSRYSMVVLWNTKDSTSFTASRNDLVLQDMVIWCIMVYLWIRFCLKKVSVYIELRFTLSIITYLYNSCWYLLGSIVGFLFITLYSFGFTMTQGNWIEKSGGKKVEVARPGIRITVPKFDNSELIASYSKTLIGRCMNPPRQDMNDLLFMLSRIWNVEGRVVGVDLGLGRFQFNFDLEEDIVAVLKMEPFHFDHWMLSLVRWKPVLEPNYPSKIVFWVRVLDIPLHFRVAPIFQSVGEALGQVRGPVDPVGGRVRVEI